MKATSESLQHKGRRYIIRSAADFKKVPPERVGLCLEDFQQWLLFFDWEQWEAIYRHRHPILYFFIRELPLPEFEWVDRGNPSRNPLFR